MGTSKNVSYYDNWSNLCINYNIYIQRGVGSFGGGVSTLPSGIDGTTIVAFSGNIPDVATSL